jgi:HSP20 family protein
MEEVISLSEKDWRSRWLRRRPFFRGSFFQDFDDVFKEMEEMLNQEFQEFSQRTPKNLIRERKLPDGRIVRELGPFVYGYSMKIGPDGKPEVKEFGNIKPGIGYGRPHIDIKEKREPLADVMTTNGEIKVIVEMPGVEKKDIKLHGTEKNLTLSVDTPQRKYYKEVKLPTNVDPKSAKSTYKNGVLEVTLTKKKPEKPKGELIDIE